LQLGSAGVTFFFLLSGFIIYWSSRPDDTPLKFYRRRVLKIFPTHWITTLMLLAVVSVPMAKLVTWLPEVLLVHIYHPQWTYLGALNVPAWSLVAEMLFYFSFPLLKPVADLVKRNRDIIITIVVLLGFLFFLHTAYYLWTPGPERNRERFLGPHPGHRRFPPYYPANADPSWFNRDYAPLLPQLLAQLLFPAVPLFRILDRRHDCKLVINGGFRNTKIWWPFLLLVGSYALTWVVPINYKMSVLFLLPTALCIATLAMRDLQGKSVFLHKRANEWLGDISYAFYLVQYPVMVWVTYTFIGGGRYGLWGWIGFALLCFAISVVLAGLIYTFIDKPIMKNWARPKPKKKSKKAGGHAQRSIVTSA